MDVTLDFKQYKQLGNLYIFLKRTLENKTWPQCGSNTFIY